MEKKFSQQFTPILSNFLEKILSNKRTQNKTSIDNRQMVFSIFIFTMIFTTYLRFYWKKGVKYLWPGKRNFMSEENVFVLFMFVCSIPPIFFCVGHIFIVVGSQKGLNNIQLNTQFTLKSSNKSKSLLDYGVENTFLSLYTTFNHLFVCVCVSLYCFFAKATII